MNEYDENNGVSLWGERESKGSCYVRNVVFQWVVVGLLVLIVREDHMSMTMLSLSRTQLQFCHWSSNNPRRAPYLSARKTILPVRETRAPSHHDALPVRETRAPSHDAVVLQTMQALQPRLILARTEIGVHRQRLVRVGVGVHLGVRLESTRGGVSCCFATGLNVPSTRDIKNCNNEQHVRLPILYTPRQHFADVLL